MTQNTPAPHDHPTPHDTPVLRPPEFDLVARDDPIGTLDESSGLCACGNLATHQLVSHGHPQSADMVVERKFQKGTLENGNPHYLHILTIGIGYGETKKKVVFGVLIMKYTLSIAHFNH